MKAIRKIESFLCNFSWKIKLAIFLAFVFWAPQTFFPMIDAIKNNYHLDVVEAVNLTVADRDEGSRRLKEFAKPIIAKAQAKGQSYGPWDYFRDYKSILDFEHELPGTSPFYNPHDAIFEINKISNENIFAKRFTMDQVEEARDFYGLGKKTPDPPASFSVLIKEMADYGVFSWILNLYFRGLLLALILYLVRMSQDDGILAVFLSGKKKFAKAVFFWPANLLEYPKYELRKIIVEAELRRLGGVWRKLDPREQKLVKQIASRSKAEYKKWIADYELKNAQGFKRSFEWALMATVLIILSQAALPVNASADMAKLRDGPCLEQGSVYDQYDTRSKDEGSSVSPDNTPAWVEEVLIPSVPCLIQWLEVSSERFKLQELIRSVFKIPVEGYLVKSFLLQTK